MHTRCAHMGAHTCTHTRTHTEHGAGVYTQQMRADPLTELLNACVPCHFQLPLKHEGHFHLLLRCPSALQHSWRTKEFRVLAATWHKPSEPMESLTQLTVGLDTPAVSSSQEAGQ